jgi:hypothetical protein
MPIDPSIVPRIAAQSFANSPFGNLDNLMRTQIEQEELNKRRREAKTAKQMEEIWSTYGNDIHEALKRSYAVDPDKASEIQAQYSGAMANLALENTRLMDIEKKEMDADYTALWGARGDPALLNQQLDAIAQRDPGFVPVAEAIRRNPATLDQLFESRGNIDNIFARRADANEKLLKGDTKRGAAGHLAAAWGTPEFEEILTEFAPHLGPGTTNLYRGMTREQLEQASMTANERADNAEQGRHNVTTEQQAAANQDRTRAEQERHNREQERLTGRGQDMTDARVRSGVGRAGGGSGVAWSKKLDPTLATLADSATINMPGTRAPRFIGTINRLAEQGNTNEVKRMIRLAAIEGELADDKRQITGRGDAAASLDSIRDGLRKLKAAGVNTNILTGSVEDVARKLGTSSDPRLVRISTQIRDAFITYRRALTGVAFGPEEGRDYEKLFPNYHNQLPVNEAILDGLSDGFKSRDRAYWTRKFGPEGAVLVGAIEAPSAQPQPQGAANQTPIGGQSGVEVTYQGRTIVFPDQAKAAEFKRRMGIR